MTEATAAMAKSGSVTQVMEPLLAGVSCRVCYEVSRMVLSVLWSLRAATTARVIRLPKIFPLQISLVQIFDGTSPQHQAQLMPCGHTLCSACLAAIRELRADEIRFSCPTCRTVHTLPGRHATTKELGSFTRNFALEEVAGIVRGWWSSHKDALDDEEIAHRFEWPALPMSRSLPTASGAPARAETCSNALPPTTSGVTEGGAATSVNAETARVSSAEVSLDSRPSATGEASGVPAAPAGPPGVSETATLVSVDVTPQPVGTTSGVGGSSSSSAATRAAAAGRPAARFTDRAVEQKIMELLHVARRPLTLAKLSQELHALKFWPPSGFLRRHAEAARSCGGGYVASKLLTEPTPPLLRQFITACQEQLGSPLHLERQPHNMTPVVCSRRDCSKARAAGAAAGVSSSTSAGPHRVAGTSGSAASVGYGSVSEYFEALRARGAIPGATAAGAPSRRYGARDYAELEREERDASYSAPVHAARGAAALPGPPRPVGGARSRSSYAGGADDAGHDAESDAEYDIHGYHRRYGGLDDVVDTQPTYTSTSGGGGGGGRARNARSALKEELAESDYW